MPVKSISQGDIERPDPIITKDLAAWLAERIPARCIGIREAPESAHRYAGRHDLAVELIQMHHEQMDTIVITEDGEVTDQEPLADAMFWEGDT